MAEETKSVPAPAPEQPKESPAPATPAPTSGGSSKTGTKVLIIIIVIVVVLGVIGYFVSRYLARKVGESAAESILSSATGGKVDVSSSGNGASVTTKDGTVSTGDKASWPADMPGSIPKVSSGAITYSSKNASGVYTYWSVVYDKGSTDIITKYKADLVAKGWTVTGEVNSSYIDSVTATLGKLEVSLSYDPSSGGMTLAVTQTNN